MLGKSRSSALPTSEELRHALPWLHLDGGHGDLGFQGSILRVGAMIAHEVVPSEIRRVDLHLKLLKSLRRLKAQVLLEECIAQEAIVLVHLPPNVSHLPHTRPTVVPPHIQRHRSGDERPLPQIKGNLQGPLLDVLVLEQVPLDLAHHHYVLR